MICPRAIEALTKQHERFTELLRDMDNGRWWTSDKARLLDEDEVCLQAERIRSALDVIGRLATEMDHEEGTGTGSQRAATAAHAGPDAPRTAPGTGAGLEGLGPFFPGPVGPVHAEIHQSGGYEQRSRRFSGAAPKEA